MLAKLPNVDLLVRRDLLPSILQFDYVSLQSDRKPELVILRTNALLTDLNGDWYLGVPNHGFNTANFQVRAWHGVLAPAGVSPEIARKLADAVHAATREPAVQAALSKMGAEPADEVLEEFAKVIQAESVKWGEVVKRANVKVD